MPARRPPIVGLVLGRLILSRRSNVWGAFDYASCGAASGRPPPQRDRRQHRSDHAGPDILIRASPIRYGQPSGPTACLRSAARPGDRLSFELTRRFPQRTTSAVQESGIWSQENLASPIRYGQRSGDLKVDAPWFATALDSVAS